MQECNLPQLGTSMSLIGINGRHANIYNNANDLVHTCIHVSDELIYPVGRSLPAGKSLPAESCCSSGDTGTPSMNRFPLVFISVSMAISDWLTYLARIYHFLWCAWSPQTPYMSLLTYCLTGSVIACSRFVHRLSVKDLG